MNTNPERSLGRVGVATVPRWMRLTLLALVGLLLPNAWAGQLQTVHGHIPKAVASLTPVGRPSATQEVRLAIGLPLRNQTALNQFLQDLYNPSSPSYHHYLTPQQFTEQFGPTAADYQQLIDFAQAQGLTVSMQHPNRMVLSVKGAVSTVESAFHVTLRSYQHPTEARQFYAPDTEPSLDLAIPVLHISGLDNYALPHPNVHLKSAAQKALAKANATPNSGSGPSGTYGGGDFRAAYVPGTTLTGSGQNVALLQFDGYYTSDITAYRTKFGLTAIPLTNVAVNGGVSTPGTGNVEVCLDIEMVNAMAPGLSNIYVYEESNGGSWDTLLSKIATDNLAKQVSCSWSGGSADATGEQIFQEMSAQGQTFFCASGDSDAYTSSISFPCDSPHITLVGATTLTTSGAGGSYVSETVWNWGLDNGSYVGSSGGVSTTYTIPTWQSGVSMATNQGSTTMRNLPDVACVGDNIYVTYNNGSTETVGGTSCAAPLWAALTAMMNQQAASNGGTGLGFINTAVYALGQGSSYSTTFHDVTTGNNYSSSSPSKYAAVTGFDLCTGWGTPGGMALINALAGPAENLQVTGTDLTSSGDAGGSFTPSSTTYTLTNNGSASINWSLTLSQIWLSASATSGVLAAGANTTVTVSLNSGAASLAAGSYSATAAFTDTGTGVSLSHPVAVTVNAALTIAPTSLTAVTAGEAFSQKITVSGGTTPYTTLTASNFSGGTTGLTAGAVTANQSSGVVTVAGTASASGTATFTVSVTDTSGATLSTHYSLTVNPGLTLSPSTLPSASVNTAYNQTLTISGGTPPYSSVAISNFNGGVTGLTSSMATTSASAGTVTLSGTPTAAGSATFTISVTDASGATLTTNETLLVFGSGAQAAQIAVQQPAGTALASGSSSVSFVTSGVGSTVSQSFTILNLGNTNLNLSKEAFSGANAADFALTSAPSTSIAPGGSTTFTVTYTPSTNGAEAATLQITSNDPNTGTFSVALAGSVYTAVTFVTDQAAQLVIGQTSFTNQSTMVAQNITPGPSGCAISATGKLAICDQNANRVLIWNTLPTTIGQPADVVVGQPSFTSTSTTISSSVTGSCNGVAFSPNGQQLLVSDSSNNRVMIWNAVPTTNGVAADVVIGQTSFTSATQGTSATQLYYPTGLLVTPTGQLLVSDYENNRVLVYNSIPTTSGAAANVVLGQTAMTTASRGSNANQLRQPWGMALTASGQLIVDDGGNNRVVVFSSIPTSNGASASIVIGQTAFGTAYRNTGLSSSRLNSPSGVAVSSTGQLAISDFGNNRVLIYNSVPTSNGAAANAVLGQPNFTSATAFNGGISASSMSASYQGAFSPDGRLWLPGRDMYRLMVFGQVPTAPPVITSATSVGTTIGQAFSYQVVASNTPSSYAASGLPSGLSINTTTGLISGTTSATGSYSVTLSATNWLGTGTSTLALTVNPALSVTPTSLPGATAGTTYLQTITVSGGTQPYATLAVSNFSGGSTGLTASAITANTAAGTVTISGTPTASGTLTFTLLVTDAAGASLSSNYTLAVSPSLTITPATLPAGTAGTTYNQAVFINGGTTPYATFSVTNFSAGSTGLSSGAVTKNTVTDSVTVNGTPTASGTLSFTVNVADSAGAASTANYAILINPAMALSPSSLPSATAGTAYSQAITLSGGTAPYTSLTVSGFSAGTTGLTSSALSANASTGVFSISGTATAAGAASFTVNAVDTAGATISASYSLTVISSLQSWRQTYFGTTSNSGSAADTATPAGDGITNLMKFATGMNPTQSGTQPGTVSMSGGTMYFTYNSSNAAVNAGVTFSVQWSNTLASGSWSTTGVTQVSAVSQGATQLVTVSIPSTAGSATFVKLVVTGP